MGFMAEGWQKDRKMDLQLSSATVLWFLVKCFPSCPILHLSARQNSLFPFFKYCWLHSLFRQQNWNSQSYYLSIWLPLSIMPGIFLRTENCDKSCSFFEFLTYTVKLLFFTGRFCFIRRRKKRCVILIWTRSDCWNFCQWYSHACS